MALAAMTSRGAVYRSLVEAEHAGHLADRLPAARTAVLDPPCRTLMYINKKLNIHEKYIHNIFSGISLEHAFTFVSVKAFNGKIQA